MKYRLASHISHSKVDQELVVLNERNGFYVTLNETATCIFVLATSNKDEQAIAQELAREFPVSQDQALEDVRQTLADLVSHGILESGDS